MKKQLISLTILFVGMGSIFGQAVSDRNIIPVAVNLNQVLRMTVTNGGNIEFVFNTIDEYKNGISGDQLTSGSANTDASEPMYKTDFTVSSSTRWMINYGSEEATFIGVDDPTNTGLTLDNVGYTIVNNGNHSFEASTAAKGTDATAELYSASTDNANEPAALEAYPTPLIEDNDSGTQANAGDAADNSFTLVWRCGTSEGTTTQMNTTSLIEQSITPDRYVTNVLFELAVD